MIFLFYMYLSVCFSLSLSLQYSCSSMAVYWFLVCFWRTHRVTVDIHTTIPSPRSVIYSDKSMISTHLIVINFYTAHLNAYFLFAAVQHSGSESLRDLGSDLMNNVTASPSPTPGGSINDYSMHIWQGISFFLQNLLIFIR